MNLSEIKQLLRQHEILLTKSLGQSFLHDANQLRRIVRLADLRDTDRVLEIGPGLGPLTELLLEQTGQVLAIEKDGRLLELLSERLARLFQRHLINAGLQPGDEGREEFGTASAAAKNHQKPLKRLLYSSLVFTGLKPGVNENEGREYERPLPVPGPAASGQERTELRLVHGDALDYLRDEERDWRGWKLVSNLPYSVASPILVELASNRHGPERMVATLQIEVAKRLMARPGQPDYGLLTLLVQLDYQPLDWFKIPASCFYPAPEVDSACVALLRRPEPLLLGPLREAFRAIVKRGFSQRRKMMAKLLKTDWPAATLERAFARVQLDPRVRAESVSLEQFVSLTKVLKNE